jgi:hypothetical protein
MPSFAVILHLIDGVGGGVGGAVSGVAAERAAAWCRYLERACAAAVRDGDGPGEGRPRCWRVRIARRRLASPFTAREVYRNEWTGLTDPASWGGRGAGVCRSSKTTSSGCSLTRPQ